MHSTSDARQASSNYVGKVTSAAAQLSLPNSLILSPAALASYFGATLSVPSRFCPLVASLACKCPCLAVQLWPSLQTLKHLLAEHSQHSRKQFAVASLCHRSCTEQFCPKTPRAVTAKALHGSDWHGHFVTKAMASPC